MKTLILTDNLVHHILDFYHHSDPMRFGHLTWKTKERLCHAMTKSLSEALDTQTGKLNLRSLPLGRRHIIISPQLIDQVLARYHITDQVPFGELTKEARDRLRGIFSEALSRAIDIQRS